MDSVAVMIYRKPLLFAGAAVVGLMLAHAPALRAQFASPAPSVAPMTFDYDLGARSVDGATYSVKATQPFDSKLKSQRVKFTSVVQNGSATTTRFFIINTGKYKTVGELTAYLRDVFVRFLNGAPANTEIGKVGDIKYGGEVRFVVESPNVLLYNTMSAPQPSVAEPNASMTLPAAEVKAYVAILGGK